MIVIVVILGLEDLAGALPLVGVASGEDSVKEPTVGVSDSLRGKLTVGVSDSLRGKPTVGVSDSLRGKLTVSVSDSLRGKLTARDVTTEVAVVCDRWEKVGVGKISEVTVDVVSSGTSG